MQGCVCVCIVFVCVCVRVVHAMCVLMYTFVCRMMCVQYR
jgi:hypothetical protein